MYDPTLPFTTDLTTVFVIFLIMLIFFHAVFICKFKFGKMAWKATDYAWLILSTLGLIVSVGQARSLAASGLVEISEASATSHLGQLKQMALFYASDPGPFCRTFIRSEMSPPPGIMEKVQGEYRKACSWAKQASKTLDGKGTIVAPVFTHGMLPAMPSIADDVIKDVFKTFDQQLQLFDEAAVRTKLLNTQKEKTTAEFVSVGVGPFLLAFALAMRITKVTGEIVLEVKDRRSKKIT
jgi:hypothetical protein